MQITDNSSGDKPFDTDIFDTCFKQQKVWLSESKKEQNNILCKNIFAHQIEPDCRNIEFFETLKK